MPALQVLVALLLLGFKRSLVLKRERYRVRFFSHFEQVLLFDRTRILFWVLSVAELLLQSNDLLRELVVALFNNLGIHHASQALSRLADLLERLAELS